METEFMLIQDDSCDWYVIPADRHDEWGEFCGQDFANWDGYMPQWARYVPSTERVKFKSFRVD